MGQHNALQQYTELLDAYSRALGERDGWSGIERGGETLTPVIDLWSQPDWDYLRGVERRSTVTSIGIGAGTSELQIWMPPGTGLLFVVTHLLMNVASNILLELVDTALLGTGDVGLAAMDSRLKSQSSIVRQRSGNAGAAVTARWRLPAEQRDPDSRWIVKPGSLLRIGAANTATAMIAAVQGYQRRALPGELE